MYNLPEFKEHDEAAVLQFVRDNPFAFLTGCDEKQRPVATQVPVFIDEREGKLFLSGHMMKKTDHQAVFAQNNNVLAVFTGPNTYVSASWYTDKRQGSTWNYMSVHARGVLKFLDRQALLGILERTTSHFENNPQSGANFKDLPEEYIQHMANAIVAFEIEVQEMNHVFKLSQNRDEESYENIIRELDKRGNSAKEIAALMRARKSKVFPL